MNHNILLEKLIDEEDFAEGSAFTIAAMKAAQKGEPTFKIGGKTFKTKVSKEKADKFFQDKKDEADCGMEENDMRSEEGAADVNEAKKKKVKKYYGPKQYGAPVGSSRAAQLKKASDLYKKGDIEGAAKIRQSMEKKQREKPGFNPKKSQYTDSKNEAEICESVLNGLLDDMLMEILSPEEDLIEEKKKKTRKKVSGSTRTALKNKAEKHNAPLGALTTVYNKGMGAYVSSGSRKGMGAQQWAMARVNSFLKGGKARKVDDAQWKQVQKFRKRKRVSESAETVLAQVGGENYLVSTRPFEDWLIENNESFNQALLNEGFAKSTVIDFVQYAVEAAAEYGITIGTGGLGIEAGVAAEEVIAAMFATESVAEAIAAVQSAAAEAKEITGLLNSAKNLSGSLRSNPEKFYEDVNKLLAKLLYVAGKKAGGKMDAAVKKVKEIVEKIIDKMTDAVARGIKVLIPEATVAQAVATSVRAALSVTASKAFTSANKILEVSADFKEFILVPKKASGFFREVAESLLKILEKIKSDIEKKSEGKGGIFGELVDMVDKKVRSAISNGIVGKLIDAIKSNMPKLLQLIDKIVEIVIPTFFGALAVYQSASSGDYKKYMTSAEKSEKSSEPSEEKETKKEAYAAHLNKKKMFEMKQDEELDRSLRYAGVR